MQDEQRLKSFLVRTKVLSRKRRRRWRETVSLSAYLVYYPWGEEGEEEGEKLYRFQHTWSITHGVKKEKKRERLYRFQHTWSITHGVKKEKKRERDCIAFSIPGLLPTG